MRLFLLPALILAGPALAQTPDIPDAATVMAEAAVAAKACVEAAGPDEAKRAACVGETYQSCFAAATTPNTISQTVCAAGELDYWKEQLNSAYDSLYAALEKADTEEFNGVRRADALEAAQKAWLAWRSAECDYQASSFGMGSGSGPMQVACEMDLTGKRALDLQGWAGAGDM